MFFLCIVHILFSLRCHCTWYMHMIWWILASIDFASYFFILYFLFFFCYTYYFLSSTLNRNLSFYIKKFPLVEWKRTQNKNDAGNACHFTHSRDDWTTEAFLSNACFSQGDKIILFVRNLFLVVAHWISTPTWCELKRFFFVFLLFSHSRFIFNRFKNQIRFINS